MKYLLIIPILYLALGITNAFIQQQTPYQENPIWALVLLWPAYWI